MTFCGSVCDFVDKNTVYIRGVGDVCQFATFDFKNRADPEFSSIFENPIKPVIPETESNPVTHDDDHIPK